ncbi:MAG: hypothetical protein JSW28_10495 [Thermoplasmata archaeon]|nr:MAG: hypothetical protein JSW28_10495 [Thermoplasmata archaeon]
MDKISKRFWEDQKWGLSNISNLRRKYSDMWVSIYNKRVVMGDKDLGKVEEETKRIIGSEEFAVIYVECGTHIY